MSHVTVQDADVLILGAGLAGLRAAWAAAATRPNLRVAVAWAGNGPSGSSFANPNGQLGLFLPHLAYPEAPDETLGERLAADVLRLAAPGRADPNLVRALAEDAPERFEELAALGIHFLQDGQGGLLRRSSCFLPGRRGAVVFDDLPQVFAHMRNKVSALGVVLLPGLRTLGLLTSPDSSHDSGRILGAVFRETGSGAARIIRARTVIAAMGGPARLFTLCGSGAGNRGEGHALLALAGADMENERFLQFMWSEVPSGGFFPFSRLAGDGVRLMGPDGREEALPRELAALTPARMTHCPLSHSLPDAALDRHLLARLGPDGTIRIRESDGRLARIAPLAHAGNGGARIDGRGRTTTPGLYAAGECATGMHGADRIGGAMVLACLVFGARAGKAAANEARDAPPPPERLVEQLAAKVLAKSPESGERAPWSPPITPDMQGALVLGEGPALAALAERFEQGYRETGDLRAYAAWRLARRPKAQGTA